MRAGVSRTETSRLPSLGRDFSWASVSPKPRASERGASRVGSTRAPAGGIHKPEGSDVGGRLAEGHVRARIVRFSIVAFWLATMAWLVRYEAFPHVFGDGWATYRQMFSQGPLLADSWMRITFQGQPIGFAHTKVDFNERDPSEQVVIDSLAVLEMSIMGEPQRVRMTAGAALDALYELQRFDFCMASGPYSVRLDGARQEDRSFKVRLRTPAGTDWLRVELPDDVIIQSALVDTPLVDVEPGREIRLRTLDPVSLSVVEVRVRGLRRETIEHAGRRVETLVLSTEFQGMEVLSWLGPQGEVLRQETPFGWVLEACAPEEAVAWKPGGPSEDVLGAMAMPARGVLADPRRAREIRVRFHRLRLAPTELTTHRQTVERVEATALDLRVTGDVLPEHGEPCGYAPTEIRRYLGPSPFIQSQHPEIVARAREIVGECEDTLQAALALNAWVFRHVRKTSASSLPSALDVLRNMEGDCNEHTYLFTALARAAGIPARVLLGVVYLDGAFYYHAWPAVYVGRWLELDPTLGQDTVDATHVYLAEGEGGGQLKLLSVIGQVQAEILERDGHPVPSQEHVARAAAPRPEENP